MNDKLDKKRLALNAVDKLTIEHFRARFCGDLEKLTLRDEDLRRNIWILNDFNVPLVTNNSVSFQVGALKTKYHQIESELKCYALQKPSLKSMDMSGDDESSTVRSDDLIGNALADRSNHLDSVGMGNGSDKQSVKDEAASSSGYGSESQAQEIEPLVLDLKDLEGSIGDECSPVDVPFKKPHIHTFFGFNMEGKITPDIVVFPTSRESLEKDINYENLESVCVEESAYGYPNDLNVFIRWLRLFFKHQERVLVEDESEALEKIFSDLTPPTILLLSSNFNNFLFKKSSQELKTKFVNLCKLNKIRLYFYPAYKKELMFNTQLLDRMRIIWEQTALHLTILRNTNTYMSILILFKRTILRLFSYGFNPYTFNFHTLYQLGPTPDKYKRKEELEFDAFVDVASNCFRELFKLYAPGETLSATFERVSESLAVNRSKQKEEILAQDSTDDEKPRKSLANGGGGGEENGEYENGTVAPSTSGSNTNIKLSDQELNEIAQWVDEMSKIGCLCIKYTYLRDLHIRCRQQVAANNGGQIKMSIKEQLASDKRWLDVVKRAEKFSYDQSVAKNENEYVARWYDIDYWRMMYYNFMRKQLKLKNPDNIWTFELIQFPYNQSNDCIKAPEKEFIRFRPKNFKPHVSVIFAFNAAGDYLPPYFVYPQQFNSKSEENDEEKMSSEMEEKCNKYEYVATNGYVTSKVFGVWLNECFLPYLKEKEARTSSSSTSVTASTSASTTPNPRKRGRRKLTNNNNEDENDKSVNNNNNNNNNSMSKNNKNNTTDSSVEVNNLQISSNIVLLYCAKLAVIDTKNLNACKSNSINLFAMTHENIMPFNYLFQKTLRKRQIDLFLDSWRKITSKISQSCQIKTRSKQKFSALFMDMFQNCIEEIANTSEVVYENNNNSSINHVDNNKKDQAMLQKQEPQCQSAHASSESPTQSFKKKMMSSFEVGELWPIKDEDYEKYINNYKEKISKEKPIKQETID